MVLINMQDWKFIREKSTFCGFCPTLLSVFFIIIHVHIVLKFLQIILLSFCHGWELRLLADVCVIPDAIISAIKLKPYQEKYPYLAVARQWNMIAN
jgi:hypothetical protein